MGLRRVSATLTTDGSGDATAYTPAISGLLHSVHYTPGTLATGADLTITDETTGIALLTITNGGTSALQWRPRVGAHPVANTAGGTIIPGGTTTGGDGIAQEMNPVAGRIKIVVAQGGAAGTGSISFSVIR